MEGMVVIGVIVVALLNIILFFKIWGMTSNTKKILLFLQAQRPDLEYKEEDNNKLAHYGERAQEKKY